MSDFEVSPAARRVAQIAQVLSRAVRHGEADADDVLRILRQEVRGLATEATLRAATRSVGAQTVVERLGASAGVPGTRESDALRADQVHPFTTDVLHRTKGVEGWLRELARLGEIVCLTASEQRALRTVEQRGVTGPERYAAAGIAFMGPVGLGATPAPLLAA
jgi:hypothetical protein